MGTIKLIFTFILLFNFFHTLASEIQILKNKKSILLISKKFTTLVSIKQSFLISSNFSQKCLTEIISKDKDKYAFNIIPCLNHRMASLLIGEEQFLNKNGPNCYNSSLYLLNYLPHLRFSAEKEFKSFLNFSNCHEIKADKIKAHDIAVLINQNHYVHTFTFINPELGISKHGGLYTHPHKLYKVQDIYEQFASYAGNWTYFRCPSLNTKIKQKLLQLNQLESIFFHHLISQQEKINHFHLNKVYHKLLDLNFDSFHFLIKQALISIQKQLSLLRVSLDYQNETYLTYDQLNNLLLNKIAELDQLR